MDFFFGFFFFFFWLFFLTCVVPSVILCQHPAQQGGRVMVMACCTQPVGNGEI